MLKIIEAKKEDRDTVMNLLEKYLYEFSQWEKTGVNDNVLCGYEFLFVRLALIAFLASVVGIVVTYKKR